MIEIIEQNFRGYKDTEETLKRQVYGVIESVKNSDPVEFLSDVLDIHRTQFLKDGQWETLNYEICLAWGGPGIWLNTDGTVKGFWWGERLIIKCDDKDFLEKLEEMENYLDEMYIT